MNAVSTSQLPVAELSDADRAALIQKALAFRMTAPYGGAFERSDAYEECVALGSFGLRHAQENDPQNVPTKKKPATKPTHW